MTRILDTSSTSLLEAKKILESWWLVAFPTETVYGLGADGLDRMAVAKIFEAKGRPQDNPLILHISRIEDFDRYALSIPEYARLLMETFCPGPLTFVLEKRDIVPDIVTAGLSTVCLRIPNQKSTLDLIDLLGFPLAWPSANRSGRPSPTSAPHVLEDLDGRIDAVIDGGETDIGIESTVLDFTGEKPVILREGAVTREMIEETLGYPLDTSPMASQKSPGTRYRHYAPDLPIILSANDERSEIIERIMSWEPSGFIYYDPYDESRASESIFRFSTLSDMSHALFHLFRESEKRKYQTLYIERIEEGGIGRALMNRIEKAASKL